jgi:hypothetical protein
MAVSAKLMYCEQPAAGLHVLRHFGACLVLYKWIQEAYAHTDGWCLAVLMLSRCTGRTDSTAAAALLNGQ